MVIKYCNHILIIRAMKDKKNCWSLSGRSLKNLTVSTYVGPTLTNNSPNAIATVNQRAVMDAKRANLVVRAKDCARPHARKKSYLKSYSQEVHPPGFP